jgi:vacuolar-type H+-ATPase subunit I/STV1
MKKAKIRKIIQKPLRFHHQDIHEEIEGLTDLIMQIGNRLILIEKMLEQLKKERTGG